MSSSTVSPDVWQRLGSGSHEHLSISSDSEAGLTAVIAIHSTALGPALGGCRMRFYPTLEGAVASALDVSELITYRNALAGLNFGGGIAILSVDPEKVENRIALFLSFGGVLNSLGGRFITAEDYGTSLEDINTIYQRSDFVAGKDPKFGGGGDPAPYTAFGLMQGIRASLKRAYNSEDFVGRTFAIQGVGNVGRELASRIRQEGGSLVVADIDVERAQKVAADLGASVLAHDDILFAECDVLCPCAVGNVISLPNVGGLRCKVVLGAANNLVKDRQTEQGLVKRGVIFVPDFVVNSGGVVLCADEAEPGGFSKERVIKRITSIFDTTTAILDESARSDNLPSDVAKRLATKRIDEALGKVQ